MKLEIVQSEQEKKEEPITKLELRYDGNDIDVVAHVDGVSQAIVSFMDTGELFLYSGDTDEFARNKDGKIVVIR